MQNIFFKSFTLTLTLLIINSCGNKNNTVSEIQDQGYEDGAYCGQIDYYNPNTGTRSTYTLEVEIENNELTVIHWPNGGWLDDSHFTPIDISTGEASFTSDKEIEYTVRIIGKSGECNFDTFIPEDNMVQTQDIQFEQQESEENINTEDNENIEE